VRGLAEWLDRTRRERGVVLMGVLNATPDSFFDGGRYEGARAAEAHVDRLVAGGAQIIDIGAESSRPGAEPVAPEVQIERMGPALQHAVKKGVLVSVDTTSAEVAEHALGRGARIVNDVSCLADPGLATVVARHEASLVVMHSRGSMREQPGFSAYPDDGYADVVRDVRAELGDARERAVRAGVDPCEVWLDPGLGFKKNARQSLELIARLSELAQDGSPIVVGPSRKSFIAAVDGASPEDRLGGTIAACLLAAERGAAILRVHDVAAVRQALGVERLARRSGERGEEARHA
jgi:dihydropteroate synthase